VLDRHPAVACIRIRPRRATAQVGQCVKSETGGRHARRQCPGDIPRPLGEWLAPQRRQNLQSLHQRQRHMPPVRTPGPVSQMRRADAVHFEVVVGLVVERDKKFDATVHVDIAVNARLLPQHARLAHRERQPQFVTGMADAERDLRTLRILGPVDAGHAVLRCLGIQTFSDVGQTHARRGAKLFYHQRFHSTSPFYRCCNSNVSPWRTGTSVVTPGP